MKHSACKLAAFLAALLGAALLCAAASCCPTDRAAAEVVVMGFVPSEDAQIIGESGEKLVEILGRITGLRIRAYVLSSYMTVVSAMRTGDVDVGWLPPLAAVRAEDRGWGVIRLKAVRQGNPFYYGSIIVRTDSGIESVEDLRGRSIAWGDFNSFSGHIFPKYGLISMGIYNDDFFASERFLGSHYSVVVSVLNGQVDAGAVFSNNTEGNDGAWTQMLTDPERQRRIAAIFYTDPIPGDTVSLSSGFWSERRQDADAIVAAIQELHRDPVAAEILMELYHISRMVPAASEEYDVVRTAAESVLGE